MPDGQPGVVCYFYETTLLKRAEAILRSHHEHLERTIAERTEELKRAHEQLRRSETLAVLGALSRGIAHDLSNILLPLGAQIDRALRQDLPPEAREPIEAIGNTSAYLRDLSQRLRDYVKVTHDPLRGQSGRVEEVHLDRWCSETESFLRSVVPPEVDFECRLSHSLPAINVNKAALTQALYNLVQNAGQVIAEHQVGGRVELYAQSDDGMVRIVVEDDGPGMPPEVRERCLDPFFTTGKRSVGGGTGIGLSLVKGFVESCGGSIEVHSPPGSGKERGTAFVLNLPRACGEQANCSRETRHADPETAQSARHLNRE